jgi:glycosyltransferase involved in cell wall biosynthesis
MSLIYSSPVPWGSFSQRPHELARHFHAVTGSEVLWLDPYPGRFPSISDVLGRRPRWDGTGGDIPPWLTVVKPAALPIEPLPYSGVINRVLWGNAERMIDRLAGSSTILGIGKPTAFALHLLATQRFSSSFYDAMDNYPAFYKGCSRIAMAKREQQVIRKVSMVLTSSSALRDRLQHLSADARHMPNACAVDRMPGLASTLQGRNREAPVMGYVGTIGSWFDWEMVIRLARSNPEASVRIIGPLFGAKPRLPRNISLEPAVSHAQAIAAMKQFSVGLIPFKKTALTASVDPIKFYEYRAMGLPVISSDFGEMALRKKCTGTCLVDRDSDMAEAVKQALAYKATQESVARFRERNSWEVRFSQAAIFAPSGLSASTQEVSRHAGSHEFTPFSPGDLGKITST